MYRDLLFSFEMHCSDHIGSTWSQISSVNVFSMRHCLVLLCAPSGGVFLPLHHTSPPMSVSECMPYMGWLLLQGAWLAAGQIVWPVGRFSVHSWFPFQSSPILTPHPSTAPFSCTWTHRAKTLAHTSPCCFYCGLFRADSCATFLTSTHIQQRSIV